MMIMSSQKLQQLSYFQMPFFIDVNFQITLRPFSLPYIKDVLLKRIECEYKCCDQDLVINGYL